MSQSKSIQAVSDGGGSLTVDGTLAVTAASLPLPTGAATDGTDITTPTAMPAGGAGIRGWLSAIWTKLNGTLLVDGSAVTQPVSGTFWQATQPVSMTEDTSMLILAELQRISFILADMAGSYVSDDDLQVRDD